MLEDTGIESEDGADSAGYGAGSLYELAAGLQRVLRQRWLKAPAVTFH